MFGILLAALTAPLLAFAAPMELSKRTPGRATYFAVGLGACGQNNVASDFVSISLMAVDDAPEVTRVLTLSSPSFLLFHSRLLP